MRELYGFSEGLCPVAEDIASRTIALPFFPGIEADDQEYVVDSLRASLS
jgi:dTDP-4-amino-4,6-dideoxygalactose transaminase